MNITEPQKPSCNSREDGDETGSERPLKKARFAWQVKGKYHLKNETDECNKTPTVLSEPSSSNEEDCSQIKSVIDPDTSLLAPNTSVSRELLPPYPRYISSSERTPKSSIDRNRFSYTYWSHAFTPQELINISEDQCILQWQYGQLLQSSVDNILNQAFERLLNVRGDDGNSRFLAFDFAEFINHFPGDNSVENEGIMMAISAHGLQNTTELHMNNNINLNNRRAHCVSLSSLFENWSSEEDQPPAMEKAINDTHIQSSWQSDNQNSSETPSFEYTSEPSHSSNSSHSDHNQNSNADVPDESDFDIMNAAILYAIKTKGLAVSGTEYC